MKIIITTGYWLIPLLITVTSFFIASRYEKPRPNGYINLDIEGIYRLFVALIVSLVAWLIWALFT